MNVSSEGYQAAIYDSGNGTANFVFLYTVQPGDHSANLEYWNEEAFKTDGFVRRAADQVFIPTIFFCQSASQRHYEKQQCVCKVELLLIACLISRPFRKGT